VDETADVQKERALRQLTDERDICATLYRYAHSLDFGLEADWVDCFTDDAVWHSRRSPIAARGTPDRSGGARAVRGRDELAQFAAHHTRPPEAWHKHLLCESRVDLDGDHARADSYFARIDVDPTGSFIRAFGRYRDDLVRCPDGRWRIQERLVEIDGTHPLAEPSTGPNAAHALVIEDIERLKARYCRLLDGKHWDEWGELFTDDARLTRSPDGEEVIEGRPAIVDRVRRKLAGAATVHQVSMPDIEIVAVAPAMRMTAPEERSNRRGTARGVWGVTASTETPTASTTRWGHYEETYELGADGKWRIASLRFVPLRVEESSTT
jgi:SnoaL-like protein